MFYYFVLLPPELEAKLEANSEDRRMLYDRWVDHLGFSWVIVTLSLDWLYDIGTPNSLAKLGLGYLIWCCCRCIASENETLALRNETDKLRNQIEQLNGALHELGRENQTLQVIITAAPIS